MEISDYVKEFNDILECLAGFTWIGLPEKITVALEIMKERAKDRRMVEIRRERAGERLSAAETKKPTWRDEPATQDQINFLREHKITFDASISKGTASDLISKEIEKWKK